MTRYQVTVFVNVDEDYHFESLKPTDKIAEVDTFLIEAVNPEWAASFMWTIANKIEPDLELRDYPRDVRSLSVGDLIKVAGGGGQTFFAVESLGWKEIPEPTNPVVALEGTPATSRTPKAIAKNLSFLSGWSS